MRRGWFGPVWDGVLTNVQTYVQNEWHEKRYGEVEASKIWNRTRATVTALEQAESRTFWGGNGVKQWSPNEEHSGVQKLEIAKAKTNITLGTVYNIHIVASRCRHIVIECKWFGPLTDHHFLLKENVNVKLTNNEKHRK